MAAPRAQLAEAAALLQRRQAAAACAVLEPLAQAFPDDAETARLLAAAQLALGDAASAERSLRAALASRPAHAELHAALGDVLLRRGEESGALTALREALRHEPALPAPCLALARLLRARGCLREALHWARRLVDLLPQVPEAHAELARTLAACGRHDEAVAAQRRALTLAPDSAAAVLNLALALVDAARPAQAARLLRALQHRGIDLPELWFGLARAQLAQEQGDEAEASFRRAIERRPDYLAAHVDLAQALWMRHGDLARACADIDALLARNPTVSALRVAKAGLYRNAGEVGVAYAQLRQALTAQPDDVELQLAAADVALAFDADTALAHAERAAALAPADTALLWTLGDAQLGAGQAAAALATAQRLLERNPDDQHALALRTSAERLGGGPRDPALSDYAQIVRAWRLDTPAGWPDLPAYLRDLATSLRRLHTTRAHPLGQTLRQGTQTNQDLMRSDDPSIRAFVQAVDGPIRRHLEALGQGTDALRRHNRGSYRILGMWSVQLRPYGFHVNHFHPEGWLSSACYIDLPPALGDETDRAGWIAFGEPGIRTRPALPPEHFVRPEPGLLVLFPSYLWHGTVPFAGAPDDTRLTIAFDIQSE